MEQIDRWQRQHDHIRIMDTAAAFARRTGMATQVILPREPATVTAAREIAQQAGITVSVALEADSVVVRFQMAAAKTLDERQQPA